MFISVVIPSYNRCDCIVNLLEDLEKQTYANFEVIVVDDCSPDHTIETVREKFPSVKLALNEKNSGPSVTRNHGIKIAQGEIIVGLDSDVGLTDEKLLAKIATLFKSSTDQKIGFAFRLFEPDGENDDKPRWWHSKPIETHANKIFETIYFSGTAYAFRKADLESANYFPEIYYMHYEEVELAFRLMDHGVTLYYHPDLSVLHFANPVSRRNEIEIFYKPRNQFLLAVGCFPPLKAITFLTPRFLFQSVRSLCKGHFFDFVRAMKSFFDLLPERLEQRKTLSTKTLVHISKIPNLESPIELPRLNLEE